MAVLSTLAVAPVLSAESVRSIRQGRADGVSLKELAYLFGVSKSTVCDVLARRTWADVA